MVEGKVASGAPVRLRELLVPRRGDGVATRLLVVALHLWLIAALALMAGGLALLLRVGGLGGVLTLAEAATAVVFLVFIWIVVAGALFIGVAHLRRPRG